MAVWSLTPVWALGSLSGVASPGVSVRMTTREGLWQSAEVLLCLAKPCDSQRELVSLVLQSGKLGGVKKKKR